MRSIRLLFALLCLLETPAAAQSPIFRISAEESWVNLHHFLYVLGRARNNERDARSEAVVGAIEDEATGLARLSDAERDTWNQAVATYSASLSKLDPIFNDSLGFRILALGTAGDRPTLESVNVPPPMRAVLERAMPVYRKAWWSEHREWNRSWAKDVEAELSRLGVPMRDTLVRDFVLPWPKEGVPVHVAAFANWAGAYSTVGGLLVIASNTANPRGPRGLEAVFHESAHQWDDSMDTRISQVAGRLHRKVPGDLSHAIIFYTTGDAMKRLVPSYRSYGDVAGVFNRGLAPYLAPLKQEWQPWLDHKGTLIDALSRVIGALPSTRPAQGPKTQVEALHTAMMSAFKAEPASTAKFYANDAAIVGGGMRLVGRAEVDDYWRSMSSGATWMLEVLDVGGLPDAPWVHGRSTLTRSPGRVSLTEYIGLLQRGADDQLRFRVDAYAGGAGVSQPGDEACIRKLDSLWADIYARNDTASALQLYAPSLVFMNSDNRVKSLDDEMGDIRPSPGRSMEYFRTSPGMVKSFDRMAIVTGTAESRFSINGTASHFQRPYAVLYARGGPLAWRIVAVQMGVGRAIRDDTSAGIAPRMQIAITIDDVPWNGPLPGHDSLAYFTGALIRTLRESHAPAAVFVSCRDDGSTLQAVSLWQGAGMAIGNHVAGHLGIQATPARQWTDAVSRCDRIIRRAGAHRAPAFFRYPMLREGATVAQRRAADSVFRQLGYRVAPVTIDNSDYLLARPYDAARRAGDSASMRALGLAMVEHDLEAVEHFQGVARARFGRDVRHVLLLHANNLTVDWLNPLLGELQRRGARFITLDEALRDPVYALPDDYGGSKGLSWLYRARAQHSPAAGSKNPLWTWDDGAAARLTRMIARQ